MQKQILRLLGDNRPAVTILAIAALFAALLGCGGGGTNGSTTSETTGSTGSTLPENRIFFSDGSGAIKHMEPNGSDLQTYVTLSSNFAGFAQSPVAGPTKMAFGYTATPGPNANYSLYVNSSLTIAGATRLTTTTFKDFSSIQFTPDGSKIVMTAANLGSSGERLYKLYVISATTPNQVIASNAHFDDAENAMVSPTGARIVYTYFPQSATTVRIKAIDIDGTGAAVLTSSGDNLFPQYNKTGTKISFSSNRLDPNNSDFFSAAEIFVMNSNGTGQTQLTSDNGLFTNDRNYDSSWSPDGSQIAYTRFSLTAGKTGIYVIGVGGGSPTQIYAGGLTLPLFWSPAGDALSGRGVSSGGGATLFIKLTERLKQKLGIAE
jgi:dipeptidyl aminopeptidase/acylaminoacyl peptidase